MAGMTALTGRLVKWVADADSGADPLAAQVAA